MTLDEIRAHLNRPPPPGSWRDFETPAVDERDWYEFDLERAEKGAPFDEQLPPVRWADSQMEAGHA